MKYDLTFTEAVAALLEGEMIQREWHDEYYYYFIGADAELYCYTTHPETTAFDGRALKDNWRIYKPEISQYERDLEENAKPAKKGEVNAALKRIDERFDRLEALLEQQTDGGF